MNNKEGRKGRVRREEGRENDRRRGGGNKMRGEKTRHRL